MMRSMKAFTLLELLVVVIILGILASIALPQYNRVVARAQAAEALTQLKLIVDAEQAHELRTGSYVTIENTAVASEWEAIGLDTPNADAGGAPRANHIFIYSVDAGTERATATRDDGHATYNEDTIIMNVNTYDIITGDGGSTHPH